MRNNARARDRGNIPMLSLLQAATLFLWVVPTLADKTVSTRLDFKDGRNRLDRDKSLSAHLITLFVKRILDRERLPEEKREAYGYFFSEVTRVRISGWPDTYDVRKPIPEELKAALEEAAAVPPPRRAKRVK